MRPIRDIAELQERQVLYHSAFGFAQVVHIGEASVEVEWENPDDNLPAILTRSKLRRVYSLCAPNGFFEQAFHDSESLRELIQVSPTQGLLLLLSDLSGPQHRNDLRDWLISRNLMTGRAFDRWWENLQPMIASDDRIAIDNDYLSLKLQGEEGGPLAQLDNPSINPGQRLEIALKHRNELGEEGFERHVFLAWKNGNKQIRDLALATMKNHHPQVVLRGLLAPGPNNLEALIHAIRRAGWRPGQFDESALEELYDTIRIACGLGGPLDNEGRLAAAILRWGAPNFEQVLANEISNENGQRLLMATCAALAPKRALHLVQELLILCLEQNQQKPGRWLAQHLMRELDLDGPELGERLLESSQEAGKLVLSMFGAGELAEYVEEPLLTMEIDMEPIDEGPTPFARLPVPSPSTFIRIGCALASAMSEIHEKGKLVHPTSMTLELMMDGVVRITGPGIVIECPKPLNEAPSKKTDIYAAAVLLIEVFLGRSWPRNVPAYKVLPYLRGVLKDLPPSALAPLDSALHPDPKQRPADAEAWLQHWTLCASTESRRATSAGLSDALIDTGYDTHVGFNKILYTQTNQDAVFAATKRHLGLLTVCDGISTANAGSGDVASGITSHVVASLWEQATGRLEEAGDQERQDFIIRALRMANRAVCEAALRFAGGQMEGRIPMGTTAVVAATHGNRISLGWLGDSRAYIIGPYGAALLTADMNQAYERLDAWVRGSEVDWDPTGYALVGYIGHFNEWLRSEALPPKQFHFNLLPGESIVLCTDGITDYIGDTHPESATRLFHRVVNHKPLDAARRLVTLANEGGGGDNATAVIATLDSPWQTDDE